MTGSALDSTAPGGATEFAASAQTGAQNRTSPRAWHGLGSYLVGEQDPLRPT